MKMDTISYVSFWIIWEERERKRGERGRREEEGGERGGGGREREVKDRDNGFRAATLFTNVWECG